jgi:hypothetical protein
MTIKYAEITVIKNLEEESIFYKLFRFVGYENYNFTDSDTIIISFDDDIVFDIKDNLTNEKVAKFGVVGEYNFPIYFDLSGKTFFLRKPNEVEGIKILNFNEIFKQNKKYNQSKKEPSYNNIIYYIHDYTNNNIGKTDAFSLLRIKSSEEKPRFLVAYDESLFNKDNLTYLLNCMLKRKFEN